MTYGLVQQITVEESTSIQKVRSLTRIHYASRHLDQHYLYIELFYVNFMMQLAALKSPVSPGQTENGGSVDYSYCVTTTYKLLDPVVQN